MLRRPVARLSYPVQEAFGLPTTEDQWGQFTPGAAGAPTATRSSPTRVPVQTTSKFRFREHCQQTTICMYQPGFCRDWSSRPEDDQRLKRASSADLSLPALGKQQLKAKAAFPWVTKLLVSALVVLFAVQVT